MKLEKMRDKYGLQATNKNEWKQMTREKNFCSLFPRPHALASIFEVGRSYGNSNPKCACNIAN